MSEAGEVGDGSRALAPWGERPTPVSDLTSFALVIEYDGTDFAGFQFQPGRRTIQAELERALGRATGAAPRLSAAGRTDAGVHAAGQVVSFATAWRWGPERLVAALNHYLPPDVAVRRAVTVPQQFDARRAACSRTYLYKIWNAHPRSPLRRRDMAHIDRPLDGYAMAAAAAHLVGLRDLRAFAAGPLAGRPTVREVFRAEVCRQGDLVCLELEASSFLQHQVRLTAGTLIRVGLGALSVADFKALIAAGDRRQAGPNAPAAGLCLQYVRYAPELGLYQ